MASLPYLTSDLVPKLDWYPQNALNPTDLFAKINNCAGGQAMPVRFRCVYCNQLLGISSRKVGSVVSCTSCDGQIIVPEAEPAMQMAGSQAKPTSDREHAALPNDLLERNDIDDLLKPFEFDNAAPEPTPPPCPAPILDSTTPTRRTAMIQVIVALVVTAIIAFSIGFLVGRGTGVPQ